MKFSLSFLIVVLAFVASMTEARLGSSSSTEVADVVEEDFEVGAEAEAFEAEERELQRGVAWGARGNGRGGGVAAYGWNNGNGNRGYAAIGVRGNGRGRRGGRYNGKHGRNGYWGESDQYYSNGRGGSFERDQYWNNGRYYEQDSWSNGRGKNGGWGYGPNGGYAYGRGPNGGGYAYGYGNNNYNKWGRGKKQNRWW